MVRNVFITGSTGGIGLATAEIFLAEGARVFLHGRNKEKLKTILADLKQKFPGKVFGFPADLTRPSDRNNLAKEIFKVFDNLNSLILCVGNGNVKKGVFLSQEEWNDILNQNFFCNIYTVELLLPLLKKTNSSICFVGSIAGLQYLKAPPAYSVAKSALNTYAKCLSVELTVHNIRVNIVHPGNICFPGGRWEELQKKDPDGVLEYIETEVPQKRFGNPKEIADTIAFLCSDKASFITGSSLVIDGGQLKAL